MTIVEWLKRDEGRRAIPYQDTRGFWTVGYGHKMTNPLSDAAMDQILADDIQAATDAARAVAPTWAQLTPARQEVLIMMAFNLGQAGLAKFRLLFQALSQEDYAGAAREMLDSTWATQVGDRATRLARQMETGMPG